MADFDSPFDTLSILAEVVSSDDEMLSLGRQQHFNLLLLIHVFSCYKAPEQLSFGSFYRTK